MPKERYDVLALLLESFMSSPRPISCKFNKGFAMAKIILLVSLSIASLFHGYFLMSHDGSLLGFELVGLLIAFACSMVMLGNS